MRKKAPIKRTNHPHHIRTNSSSIFLHGDGGEMQPCLLCTYAPVNRGHRGKLGQNGCIFAQMARYTNQKKNACTPLSTPYDRVQTTAERAALHPVHQSELFIPQLKR